MTVSFPLQISKTKPNHITRQLRLPLRVGGAGIWLGTRGLHSFFIVNY